MTEWRPINSAPKDGAKIDLWVVDEGAGRRWPDAFWMTPEYGNWDWTGWSYHDETASRDYPIDGEATHWMPIPGEPSIDGRDIPPGTASANVALSQERATLEDLAIDMLLGRPSHIFSIAVIPGDPP